jgi:Co/Zn/Cd efflux system component
MSIPGVLGYSKAHFWELQQGQYVGSLVVQVDRSVDGQLIQDNVLNVFRQLGVNNVMVQIEKDVVRAF